MCLKVTLLNLLVLKSGIKVWVQLEGNQCTRNGRFFWGTALRPSSGTVNFVLSAGCATSCSPFRKFSLSNAKDVPTQHDIATRRLHFSRLSSCDEKQSLLADVVQNNANFSTSKIWTGLCFDKALYHAVHIQNALGVKCTRGKIFY